MDLFSNFKSFPVSWLNEKYQSTKSTELGGRKKTSQPKTMSFYGYSFKCGLAFPLFQMKHFWVKQGIFCVYIHPSLVINI